MSVYVKNFVTNSYELFVKGSPEKIKELSLSYSIPSNFDTVLEDYT